MAWLKRRRGRIHVHRNRWTNRPEKQKVTKSQIKILTELHQLEYCSSISVKVLITYYVEAQCWRQRIHFFPFSKMLLVIHCIHHRRKKNQKQNHSQRFLRLSVKFRLFAAFNLNLMMTNDGNGRWTWRFLTTRAPMPLSEMFEILKWQQIHIRLNVCSVHCTMTSSQPTRIHCPT